MPLFGNGDILSFEDYNDQLSASGVDGIMIARYFLVIIMLLRGLESQKLIAFYICEDKLLCALHFVIGVLSLSRGYSLRLKSRDIGISLPRSVLTFYITMSTTVWSTGALTPRCVIIIIVNF